MAIFYLFFSLFLFSNSSSCQVPDGYYDGTDGLYGENLRVTLYNIIKNHQEQDYSTVWSIFEKSDSTYEGKVWDIYSDIPAGNPSYVYDFVFDQCGSYTKEGDCFNREHLMPQSWYSGASPMYSDLFNLYPTDGFVNNMRSNYPFGETTNPSWSSTNGSELGNCTFPGYSNIIFEPIDEYKGDIARSYFYMVTRYMYEIKNWSSDMLYSAGFTPWALELLMKWSKVDTVSAKEVSRNNAIYSYQNNRNPFIDYPEWVELIWSETAGIHGKNIEKNMIFYDGDYLKINLNGNYKILIFNMLGVVIYNKRIIVGEGGNEFFLNLKSGVYLVLMDNGQLYYSKKIICANK